MEISDANERCDARQWWLELNLRETWQVDEQSITRMGGPRYYILRNGVVREADFPAWAAWVYTHQSDAVIRHTLVDTVEVITSFLAFDQGRMGDASPFLFETMIQGGPLDGCRARYSSLDNALAGHEAAVERVRGAIWF